MKKYLNKIISVFITAIFLITSVPLNCTEVFAEITDSAKTSEVFELPVKYNVTSYKNWIINFSKEVDATKISSKDIFVTDVNGSSLSVKITQGETNKTVVINYPEEGYKPGETYYVNVNKSMVSKIGSSIKKATKMKFTISTDESVNFKPAKFSPNVVLFNAAQSQVALSSIQDTLETSDGTQQIVLKPNLFDINNISTESNLYNIKLDQIFVFESNADNPNGLSGKVISVTNNSDGNKVITFVQPKMDEIFSELEFKTKKELKAEDIISKNIPEGSTLTFNNEVIGQRDTTGGITKFSELSLKLPRFVITDQDKDKTTTDDQIALSGKLSITDAVLDTDIDIKHYSWKPLGITVIPEIPVGVDSASVKLTANSHQETTLDMNYKKEFSLREQLEQDNGYDIINKYPKGNEDKTGFKLGVTGADMGDRYVIGSVTFGLGAVQAGGLAEAVAGMPSKSIVIGATIFFTTTITGSIKVSASFNFTNDTHIDVGMKYDGQKITSIGTGVTNKPNVQFILNGEVNITTGIGVGAGLVVCGIIVAAATVDILQEINLNGYVYYQKKYDKEANFSGKLNGNLVYRVKGDAEWGLLAYLQGTLNLYWPFKDIVIKKEFGVKPDSTNLFNIKLFEWPFLSIKTEGNPTDVFAVDYFNNKDLTGKAIFSKIEKEIDHTWKGTSPETNVNKENFSARWIGDFDFKAANYNFKVSSDDGIRVYVDDIVVIDDWKVHIATSNEKTIPITEGKHTVKVEYFQETGSSSIKFGWAQK